MTILAFLTAHKEALSVVVPLIVTAAIKTMPAPGSAFTWGTVYAWAYSAAHQFFNIKEPSAGDPTK